MCFEEDIVDLNYLLQSFVHYQHIAIRIYNNSKTFNSELIENLGRKISYVLHLQFKYLVCKTY